MKAYATLLVLVAVLGFVSAIPWPQTGINNQQLNAAIASVVNAAVSNSVQPIAAQAAQGNRPNTVSFSPGAPAPGGISAVATASHSQGPQGTVVSSLTGVSPSG